MHSPPAISVPTIPITAPITETSCITVDSDFINRWEQAAQAESPIDTNLLQNLIQLNYGKLQSLGIGKFNEYRLQIILDEMVKENLIDGFYSPALKPTEIVDKFLRTIHSPTPTHWRLLTSADINFNRLKIDALAYKNTPKGRIYLPLQTNRQERSGSRNGTINITDEEKVRLSEQPLHGLFSYLSDKHPSDRNIWQVPFFTDSHSLYQVDQKTKNVVKEEITKALEKAMRLRKYLATNLDITQLSKLPLFKALVDIGIIDYGHLTAKEENIINQASMHLA